MIQTQPKLQKTETERPIIRDLSQSIKLQSQLTPALSDNIGQTWFKELKPEFSKDYFKRVIKLLFTEIII
jgi:hypothetical protein